MAQPSSAASSFSSIKNKERAAEIVPLDRIVSNRCSILTSSLVKFSQMAMTMLYLVAFTLIATFVCYGIGFVLRKFIPRYRDFQYRLSLPIIAGCAGSIIALLLMSQAMSLFLVDALYHLSLVRQYPELIIGSLIVVAYGLGGYYAAKYTMRLAHKLDLRRIAKRHDQGSQIETVSLTEIRRELFDMEGKNQ